MLFQPHSKIETFSALYFGSNVIRETIFLLSFLGSVSSIITSLSPSSSSVPLMISTPKSDYYTFHNQCVKLRQLALTQHFVKL